MKRIWVQSLGREDPLEEGMATCPSILIWRIPWTEGPGGLQSIGMAGYSSQSWTRMSTRTYTYTHTVSSGWSLWLKPLKAWVWVLVLPSIIDKIWEVLSSLGWPSAMKQDSNSSPVTIIALLCEVKWHLKGMYHTVYQVWCKYIHSFLHSLWQNVCWVPCSVLNTGDLKTLRVQRRQACKMTKDYTRIWIQIRHYHNVPMAGVDTLGTPRSL